MKDVINLSCRPLNVCWCDHPHRIWSSYNTNIMFSYSLRNALIILDLLKILKSGIFFFKEIPYVICCNAYKYNVKQWARLKWNRIQWNNFVSSKLIGYAKSLKIEIYLSLSSLWTHLCFVFQTIADKV